MSYLRPCLKFSSISSSLAAEVLALSEGILPRQQAGFLRVKSYVHAIANVERHGRCRLKEETIEFLDRNHPAIIRLLPGYEPAQTRPSGKPRRRFSEKRAKQSDQLHSLFDHSVFRKFQFISAL